MARKIKQYVLIGIGTIIIVPTLSVLSVGLFFSSIILVVAGILRTFGMTMIQMSITPDVTVPTFLSIPVSIIVALILTFCAIKSWSLLKRYLIFIRSISAF